MSDALRDYIAMRLEHIRVLQACTHLGHDTLRARKSELMEVLEVLDGKVPEEPWTMPHKNRRET